MCSYDQRSFLILLNHTHFMFQSTAVLQVHPIYPECDPGRGSTSPRGDCTAAAAVCESAHSHVRLQVTVKSFTLKTVIL